MTPPASFSSLVWQYYGFPAKVVTTEKSKICSAAGTGQFKIQDVMKNKLPWSSFAN